MKGLSLSGGGSRIDILLACAIHLTERKGYRPDWYAGVSSGLLTALAVEFGVAQAVLSDILDGKVEWMSTRPLNNNGGLTWGALWNILNGRDYLGVQRVPQVIASYISEDDWDRYRKNGHPIYGIAVCVEDASKWIQDLRKMEYDDMLQFVAASCAVPFYIRTELIDGKHWADGGWRDHIPSVAVMEQMRQEQETMLTKRLVSLSTTPKFTIGYPKGLMGMLAKVIGVYGIETTVSNQIEEEDYCEEHEIQRDFYRLRDCKTTPYDTDRERAEESIEMALQDIRHFTL